MLLDNLALINVSLKQHCASAYVNRHLSPDLKAYELGSQPGIYRNLGHAR